MDRAGRFLWLPWIRSRRLHYRVSPWLAYWEGEHEGYLRLRDPVRHRRAVMRWGEDHWAVIDELDGQVAHEYRLHWLLDDFPFRPTDPQGAVALQTPVGSYCVSMVAEAERSEFSLVRADPTTPRGWRAAGYRQRRPALSLALTAQAPRVVFWTLFGPNIGRLQFESGEARAEFCELVVRCWRDLSPMSAPLVGRITAEGTFSEEMVIS
jgi:asparagine synthase (glutamine-hydrolysing)